MPADSGSMIKLAILYLFIFFATVPGILAGCFSRRILAYGSFLCFWVRCWLLDNPETYPLWNTGYCPQSLQICIWIVARFDLGLPAFDRRHLCLRIFAAVVHV